MPIRKSVDVVQQLLDEMDAIVRNYHPEVGRTGRNVADLIQGTAFFPGGCGLWRGREPWGPMQECFPEAAIMLVAHNFDSIESHDRSKRRGGEVPSSFWLKKLLPILESAKIDPSDVFFTNALMGCKPGSAMGAMPIVAGYEDQCIEFLKRQIEIVRPLVAVALGNQAHDRLRKVWPDAERIMHPSARELNPLDTRPEQIREQAKRLAEIVSHARDMLSKQPV